MPKGSLKSFATRGILWKTFEHFSVQGFQFIIGIILARLLLPADFGLIAMLSIFIAISQSFIESGMGVGLIQKQDRTNEDFSTVFIFNFVVSLSFYVYLYFAAPFIAKFYNAPQLVPLTRIIALSLVINALAIVPRSKLVAKIDFKSMARANVVSGVMGGIVGVFFAYHGSGVWALVIRTLTTNVVAVLMFFLIAGWLPCLRFSKKSFKELFGFGFRLLISGLYARILQNIYNIAIGKSYSAMDLGYYSRGKGFAELISGTVTSILQQVTFPILASLQDDTDRMINVQSRLIKMAAFVGFPAMTLLALLAHPLIMLLLTEKWLPAVVVLQWMCFARLFRPISALNMSILNSIGRSDLFLKADLVKLPVIALSLVITIPLGLKAIVVGQTATAAVAFMINTYLPGKMFGYGLYRQIKDIFPVVVATAIMALTVIGGTCTIVSDLPKVLIGVLLGIFSYVLICHLFKVGELYEMIYFFSKLRK